MADIVLPNYAAGCISNIAAALASRASGVPAWMPACVAGAKQVVLLLLDGVGWEQLGERAVVAPFMTAMDGGAITSVVPSTTAAALTSLTTGRPPGDHGMVGYRMHVGDGAVLNTLRWTTDTGDARRAFPPRELQPVEVFGGTRPPALTRSVFGGTGFTDAHLAGTRFVGWRAPSSIAVEVARLLHEGEPFVYAYYDGVDNIAHEYGLDAHYDAELRAADALVAAVADALPVGATLVVASDHGQVDARDGTQTLDEAVVAAAAFTSGEARFRWLHAHGGETDRLVSVTRDVYGGSAIVRTRDETIAEGWFGPRVSDHARARLGDVAIVATGSTAYMDPTDVGEVVLASRHGALTSAEMLVPLLAVRA